MKLLLAIDGSTFSDVAVNEVAARPWPGGTAVKVISAIRLPFAPTAETRSLPDSDYSRMERAGMEHANASITKALTQLSAQKIDPFRIESEAIIGDAREVILDEASRWKADLIVLGSRGLGGFKRFLLGSVAIEVVTQASCSARIVRGHPTQSGETAIKILLAVDGSLCSLLAANAVAQRPWPDGSSVRIVYVTERPLVLPQVEALLEGFLAQMQETASDAIDKAMAQFTACAGDRIAVGSEILHGNPKNVILDEAEKWGADLIVLGSHGISAIERFLLGSVSLAVTMHAKCSVEVFRQPRA
jgi:nucleotide-binding universal stress UspA family protein